MLKIQELIFDIIFAQCYNKFPLGEDFMDMAKQKIIYELIQKDLHQLENSESEFSHKIKEIQEVEDIDSFKDPIFNIQIHYYQQLLSIISNIVIKIGSPNNSISYAQVIENLILEGYLSFDAQLTPYREKDNIMPIDLSGFLGVDIIRKEGCCRHFASIHNAIFHKLHLFNDIFFCYKWNTNELFKPPIHKDPKFFTADHASNLIEYNGQYYIHDSYNQQYFYFINCFTAIQAIQYEPKDIQRFLYYVPVIDKLFNNKSYREILKQMKRFEESSLKPHMDSSELNDIINKTNDRFYNSTKLLHDFREEALPYMKKIISP